MNGWLPHLLGLLSAGTPVVRMAVAQVQGSAPREAGATLLYWRDGSGCLQSHGSVGGGNLEAQSTEIARYLLDAQAHAGHGLVAGLPAGLGRRRVQRFTLGASLGQCCGGVVQMYWERFDTLAQAQALASAQAAGSAGADPRHALLRYCALDGSDREWLLTDDTVAPPALPPAAFAGRAGVVGSGAAFYFVERLAPESTCLWIYGAGHVGRALVHALAALPFAVTWIDSRADMLAQALDTLPPPHRSQITACADDTPERVCRGAPDDAWHLVMTHCHDQDLRICEALLARGLFGFLGLIGSKTKAARFTHRLRDKGYPPEQIARLVCPIGIAGIDDKQPAAIAIAVAAQLLQQRARIRQAGSPRHPEAATGAVTHG